MMNMNHPLSDPGLASPDYPDVMPQRIYRVVVRVAVAPDWPGDPGKVGESYEYAAYEAAREVLNENGADWYAEEEKPLAVADLGPLEPERTRDDR